MTRGKKSNHKTHNNKKIPKQTSKQIIKGKNTPHQNQNINQPKTKTKQPKKNHQKTHKDRNVCDWVSPQNVNEKLQLILPKVQEVSCREA